MSSISIPICDLCRGKVHHAPSIGSYNLKPQVMGLSLHAGYSKGGWGQRQDFINDWSGEVCVECWDKLEPLIRELKTKFDALRNSNTVQIIAIHGRAK